ncbi:MAG: DUF72 domain-containing protein [Euzebyales bacterium]|nr:DUF72 domain-containing protein [Euzebyales bacterium]
MTVLVGTSGWQYRDWRGAFYPRELVAREWLGHYAARFATVEINTSFYRLPPPDRFAAWAAASPHDFVLCPKVSRYLSHMKKLRDPAEPVTRFMTSARALGGKLGPVLLQLPGTFGLALDRLDAALAEFPADVRVAVELRHPSWFVDDTRRLLAEHGAALCLADRRSVEVTPPWRTAEWGYARFHEGRGAWPCYGRTALASRARTLAERYGPDAEVFAFFNNDPRGCAVRDARWFAAACRRAGLLTTRVPDAGDIRVVEPDDGA